MLGARGVDMLTWESFGEGWVTDVQKQLKLDDVRVLKAEYGELPDLSAVDFSRDVVFTWNGTTSGVRVPNGDWIPADREGLTICDATSAAFAQNLDFSKLDVVTFSWQKALGGEAAHGILILSPRAVERLETFKPANRPLPKIFRLTKGGKLMADVFEGATINTVSMLCIEDAIDAMEWGLKVGGLKALQARADANSKVIADWVAKTDWVDFLGRSQAAVQHFGVPDDRRSGGHGARRRRAGELAKAMVSRLDKAGVAYDIGGYKDAPTGFRIWCGSTVETSDLESADAVARLGLCRGKEGGAGGLASPPSAASPTGGRCRPCALCARPSHTLPSTGRDGEGPDAGTNTFTFMEGAMPKVLVSDKLSPTAVQIFKDNGVEVDYLPDLGKDKDKLLEVIGQYDGLAIRSATKVTEKIIAAATNLKVIGRAGIGVDNVDIPAATKKGIIVMNTPFGNSITTAEHAISLMLALARQIPEADASTRASQVGKEPLHGRRGHQQDAGPDRRGQYRLDRRRPRPGAQDEGRRLRSVPDAGAGRGPWGSRRSSSTSCWRAPISSRCTRR